jgi:hypothetical protein
MELKHEAYYYMHDKHGHPRVTVCLVQAQDGRLAKGMSICSMSESPVKAMGRKYARYSVLRALKNRKIDEINRFEALVVINNLKDPMSVFDICDGFKSIASLQAGYPGANNIEKRILESWT